MEQDEAPANSQGVLEDSAGPKGAGILLRLGAFAIDAALVGAVIIAWEYSVWRFFPARPGLIPLGMAIVVVGYWGWLTARNYHTPGQGFAGLTLARTDYQPLTTRRAYLRAFLFAVTSGMFVPNALLMLLDKKRRTIHDRLTTTWVYMLPEVPRYRRWIAVAAAIALLGVSAAASLIALTDMLEERTRLSAADVAVGADADH